MEKRSLEIVVPESLDSRQCPAWLFDHESDSAYRKKWLSVWGWATFTSATLFVLSTVLSNNVLGLCSGLATVASVIGLGIITEHCPSLKAKVKEMGIAGNLISPLSRSVDSYNEQVRLLKRFIEKKSELGLVTDENMETVLRRKAEKLVAMRTDLSQKIEMVTKLYGVQEGEFDDLSEVLFSDTPDAIESVNAMLKRSIEKLSARVEVEEDLSVRSIDQERKRLRG